MSSTIIYDDWSGYPIGSSIPIGPWRGSGGSITYDPTALPNSKYLQGNGGFSASQFIESPTDKVNIYFWLRMGNGFPPNGVSIVSLQNTQSPTFPFPLIIASFCIDQNWGIALTSVGGIGDGSYLSNGDQVISNSVIQTGFSLSPNVWYEISMSASLIVIPKVPPLVDTFSCGVTCNVDGVTVVSGSLADTEFPVQNTPNSSATFNQFLFREPNTGGGLGTVYITVLPAGPPNPPVPPIMLNGRISQATIEHQRRITNSNVRLSAGVIEHARAVRNGNVRVSQAVIELITKGGTFPVSGGWQIKEI